MIRFVTKVFLSIISLVFLILTTSIVVVYYKQNELEQFVLKQINKELKTPISIKDIEFSILKNFPYSSINLYKVEAIDGFEKDSLILAENILIKFNAAKIYNQNYHIEEIVFKDGSSRVYYENNLPNYQIWHESTDTSSSNVDFKLNKITFQNFDLSYNDKENNLFFDIKCKECNIELSLDESFGLNIDGKMKSKSILVNNINHLKNQDFEIESSLVMIGDSMQINSKIDAFNHLFYIDIISNNSLLVKVKTDDLSIQEAIENCPTEYLTAIENYTFSGLIDFDFTLLTDQKDSPYIETDYVLKKVTINGLPLQIDELSTYGTYKNGTFRNLSSSSFTANNIFCIVNNEKINGNISLNNLEDMFLNADISMNLNLSDIENWGYNHNFKTLEGEVNLSANYIGKVGGRKWEYDLSMAEKSASIDVSNFAFKQSEDFPSIDYGKLTLKLNNDALAVDSLFFSLTNENNIYFHGAVENMFSYLYLKNKDLKIGGHLSSNWVVLEQLLTMNDTTESDSKNEPLHLPSDVIANISVDIRDFSYNRFHMRNFKTNLTYSDKILKAKNLSLETMSGKIFCDLSFEELNSGKFRLIGNSQLDEINVRQLFYEFQNFGQRTIRHKHLLGIVNAEMYLRNEWGPNFEPIDNKLYSFLDLKISNGELLEFAPLMSMSDYISVEELERIKFSTLENQIEIKEGNIEIPFMEIHSSAIDIALAGTHSFNNEINYDIKILLNEILGNKFKRKNKKKVSEFGIVETDNTKGMTLFLKMEGTIDDPKISNSLKLAEELSKGFKKEKKVLKEILKEGGSLDRDIKTTPDYNNFIEWEEE